MVGLDMAWNWLDSGCRGGLRSDLLGPIPVSTARGHEKALESLGNVISLQLSGFKA